ncbi:MAG: dipeptide epimerase [Chitinophagaceae bacterium]
MQPLLVVELGQDGQIGLGETADNSYYGITVPHLVACIEKHRSFIEQYQLDTPEIFWKDLRDNFLMESFALCSLDIAAWDLFSRIKGKKLYEILGLDIINNPKTDFTIGIDSIEKMVSKLKEIHWPIYKIKLGTQEDVQILTELRKYTSSVFRVDANCAWGVEETIRNSWEMKRLGVELIEQPLPASNWKGMEQVFRESVLPIIADESCIVEEDVQKCLGFFHGVNIKLTKCGGITPCLRMIKTARSMKLRVMIGSMNESTIGTSAAAHLLPLIDYADMDGPLLLAEDIGEGVRINNGEILYSNINGTGASIIKNKALL